MWNLGSCSIITKSLKFKNVSPVKIKQLINIRVAVKHFFLIFYLFDQVHSYLHLETCWQEKVAPPNSHTKKSKEKRNDNYMLQLSLYSAFALVTWYFN